MLRMVIVPSRVVIMIEPIKLADMLLGDVRDSPHHDFFLCPETYDYYPSLVIKLQDPARLFRIVTYPDGKRNTSYHCTGTATGNLNLSLETLMDTIRTERPECMEWLLFHPEWL